MSPNRPVTIRCMCGMNSTPIIRGCLIAAMVSMARIASAQATPRSSVVIPIGKEKAPPVKIVTIHDTVTMVRVDTIRVVQTVLRTDTLFRFRTDTLRDSCSRGLIPLPLPIPIGSSEPVFPTVTGEVSVAPEPETFMLVGTGLAGLLAIARYFRRK